MASHILPINRESPFHLEELFFSTTDQKGIITFGNNVFIRVSKYDQADLLDQPHNIIRHPDMPHCVFRLLWDYLLKGKTIAAYVKNMAGDGSFYWVLAYVAPIPGGFLSIRLKPTGPLFAPVGKLYEELRAIEQRAEEGGATRLQAMAAATNHLTAAIQSLLMPDYDRLMAEILISEVLSRKKLLKRNDAATAIEDHSFDDLGARRRRCAQLTAQVHRLNATLHSFLEVDKTLGDSLKFAFTFGNTLRRLTLNGRILATSMGAQAVGLNEVARQMNAVSSEVAASGENLGRTMADVMTCLKTAAAEIACTDLSVEMMSLFLAELQSGSTDAAATGRNIDNLSAVVAARMTATCLCIERAAGDLSVFEKDLEHFMDAIQTLDMLYVSGRIECTRSNAADFSDLLGETVAAAADARRRGANLAAMVTRVQSQLQRESASQRQAAKIAA
jgi:aerotaxis receptor